MDEIIKPANPAACPVCGNRMEPLSQQSGFISIGCKPCHFSTSVPLETWKAAQAELDTGNDRIASK